MSRNLHPPATKPGQILQPRLHRSGDGALNATTSRVVVQSCGKLARRALMGMRGARVPSASPAHEHHPCCASLPLEWLADQVSAADLDRPRARRHRDRHRHGACDGGCIRKEQLRPPQDPVADARPSPRVQCPFGLPHFADIHRLPSLAVPHLRRAECLRSRR